MKVHANSLVDFHVRRRPAASSRAAATSRFPRPPEKRAAAPTRARSGRRGRRGPKVLGRADGVEGPGARSPCAGDLRAGEHTRCPAPASGAQAGRRTTRERDDDVGAGAAHHRWRAAPAPAPAAPVLGRRLLRVHGTCKHRDAGRGTRRNRPRGPHDEPALPPARKSNAVVLMRARRDQIFRAACHLALVVATAPRVYAGRRGAVFLVARLARRGSSTRPAGVVFARVTVPRSRVRPRRKARRFLRTDRAASKSWMVGSFRTAQPWRTAGRQERRRRPG